MADEELSAAQRAARAEQAAAEARRAAARHADAVRAQQESRRRQVPARRPPAITTKAGAGYRPGPITTVDPARTTAPIRTVVATPPRPVIANPPPAADVAATGATRPQPAARPPAPAVRAEPPAVAIARPMAPAIADEAPADVEDVAAAPVVADVAEAAAEPAAESVAADAGSARLVLPDAPRPAPDAAASTTAASTTADQAPDRELGPDARTGAVTGTPTDLPPLPRPPVPVVRTVAPTAPADGLVLPGPPRAEGEDRRPPADAAAADAPGPAVAVTPAGVTSATVDIDVQAALPEPDDVDDPPTLEVVASAPADDEVEPATAGEDPAAPERASDPEPDPAAEVEVETDHAAPAPAADAGTDRPWIRAYPPGVPDTYRYPLVPVTRFLDDAAQDFPDAAAISFLGSDLTYRQLSEQVDRLAAAFTGLGLGRGDRVGIALPWTPQLVITLHAAWRGGLDPVIIDPDAGPQELAEAVTRAAPAALVLLDTLYPTLSANRDRLASVRHVLTTGLLDSLPVLRARVQAVRLKVPSVQIPAADGVIPLRRAIDDASPSATQVDLDVEAAPALTLADGDDLVTLTHANLLAGAFQARLWIPDVQAGREGVLLAGSPADAFAIGAGLGLAMLAAATAVLPEPRPGGTARAIDGVRPTIVVAPVEEVRRILAPASKRRDLSSVRVTLTGPTQDPAVRSAMEQRTAGRLRTAAGAPGVAGMAVAQPVYADVRDGVAGLPVTDAEVRVDAPDRTGTGLLQVRGPQVAGDGWRGLGVLGRVDDLGAVTVVGPVGRVLRHRGGTSDPEVLGAALRRAAGVVDALVRGEHDGADLDLVADVSVADDSVTEAALVAHLASAAPAQSPPTRWLLTVVRPPEPEVAPEPDPEPAAAADVPESDAAAEASTEGGSSAPDAAADPDGGPAADADVVAPDADAEGRADGR